MIKMTYGQSVENLFKQSVTFACVSAGGSLGRIRMQATMRMVVINPATILITVAKLIGGFATKSWLIMMGKTADPRQTPAVIMDIAVVRFLSKYWETMVKDGT